jgi:glycosyltransferase involved in cell wall biosynthesis
MSVEISVVVPTYKREDLLARCLAALAAQDLEPERYEVIVADDGAQESTRAAVEAFAAQVRCAVRYIAVSGRHGPAAARNTGWRAAAGELIAFTDDDCIPQSGWLRGGMEALRQGAAVATGQTVVPLPPHPTDYERDTANLATAEFITANCFIRRDVLEEVGGFDERFRMAWREDSDLHFSLLERGIEPVKAASAVVVHPVRSAPWGVSIKMHRKLMYDALLFKKHPRLYRERLHRMPWRYYAIAFSALAAVVGLAAGWPALGWGGLGAWLALTAEFCWLRLRCTSWSPSHVAEMAYTSAVIPFLSFYYRILGSLAHRVWFLS